jgi:L-alanine-DL-glutamate epimerase-like enolase superfamily enzyme
MKTNRRNFMRSAAVLAAVSGAPPGRVDAAPPHRSYKYLGRVDDYREHRIIEPGRTIQKIETFTRGPVGVVRLTTSDGKEGYGQLSTFEPDISATLLHRHLAGEAVGKDPAHIDSIVDRCIEANYKFPWSFVCRALGGIDTAIWDLYGKIKGEPVHELLGGKVTSIPAYGSSMRRDISPEDEAKRLVKLRDSHGFRAFKIRIGQVNGHDGDASPGRTERLVPAVRKAVGDEVKILVDANSGYTPSKAIEVGRGLLEKYNVCHFEEPCPYWELEWTAEVAEALQVPVAGGEQDNDLAQWRRMIRMNSIDIVQPDLCYIGGLTRALRVAQMAQKANKPVVPHSANLSMVTLFTLHLLASIPNAGPYMEFSIEWDDSLNQSFYRPRLEVKDGRVMIPPGPGWGVEIDPEWLKSAQYQKSQA